jgi:hypothetical protein
MLAGRLHIDCELIYEIVFSARKAGLEIVYALTAEIGGSDSLCGSIQM